MKEVIEDLTDGDKTLSELQPLCNACGEGILLQKNVEQAVGSVNTMENLRVESVVRPLHDDVAGSEDGSEVRVGHFTSFAIFWRARLGRLCRRE